MAFKLSEWGFLKNLSARSRLFILIGVVAGIILLFYLLTVYFAGESTTGGSQVALAPSSLENTPVVTDLNKQYKTVLIKSGQQISKDAEKSGGSAVQTFIAQPNAGGAEVGGNQCIVCPEESANVKYSLDSWAREGKINDDTASALRQLADKNVSLKEYSDYLNDLVKAGTITPEQARELLDRYQKQHVNKLLNDSAKMMDGLIKSGQLPIDVANDLLSMQKRGVRPDQYAQALQRLVKEGKISSNVAQQLLAQYTQQKVLEVTAISVASLHRLTKNGEVIPEVETALIALENRHVPLTEYSNKLDQLQKSGKLAPVVAKKILDEYQWQKSQVGPMSSISALLQNAENDLLEELKDLLRDKKITQETATTIKSLMDLNVSMQDFTSAIDTLVQQKKLSPEISKLKLADYKAVRGFRDLSQKLTALQVNNASLDEYQRALGEAVQNGTLTPEQAKALLNEYAALKSAPYQSGGTGLDADVQRLQQNLQQAGFNGQQGTGDANQFEQVNQQMSEQAAQQSAERIAAIAADMGQQAQQLVAAWQTPAAILHRDGTPAAGPEGGSGSSFFGSSSRSSTTKDAKFASESDTPPLIKTGTILFAVLDTEANSDFPDMPIMATVVGGKYKGAKLLGRLRLSTTASGQQDRMGLTFNLMNMDQWIRTKTISTFAIDPETAKTALASNVNYHYLVRFGSIAASSFLQGYAQAVQQAGTTSTTNVFGTMQNSYPPLSPNQKVAVALGQVGQSLSTITSKYADIPPTVKISAGVGLGILFMADVN